MAHRTPPHWYRNLQPLFMQHFSQGQEILLVLKFPPRLCHSEFLSTHNMLSSKLTNISDIAQRRKQPCHLLDASREAEIASPGCLEGHGHVAVPSLSPAQLTGMRLPQHRAIFTASGWGEWWQGNTPVDEKKRSGGSGLIFIHGAWRIKRLL